MSLVKKILSSSLWLLIGNSIGRLAMFLANIFAARMLSQEAFGQFAMIRNTITMVESIFSSSMGSVTTKTIAENNTLENKDSVKSIVLSFFLINFFISIFLTFILVYNSNLIIEKYFLNNQDLKIPLILGSILLISNIMSSFVQNSLIGFEQFKKIALNSIIISILSIPIIYLLIYNFDLIGAISSVIFYFTLDFIFKSYFLLKYLNDFSLNFKIKDSIIKVAHLLKASFPLVISLSINSIGFWYARVLLIETDNNFLNIAIFDAAYQWLMIIMIITHATSSSILPKLSNAIGNKDKKTFNSTFLIGLLINISIALFIAVIFTILSKYIMSIYGQNYISGSFILSILAFSSIFFTITITYNKMLISINKQWLITLSVIISTVIMYLFFYLNNLNIENLAFGFLIYYLSNSILLFLFERIK